MGNTTKSATPVAVDDWGWDEVVPVSAPPAVGQGCDVLTNVDIKFVIDCTGSMSPCLREVTAAAAGLLPRINEALAAENRKVDQLRTKVVAFRDFYAGDSEPLVESEWFSHPGEELGFQAFLDGLEATGGGDAPENALEALHTAITGGWVDTGARRRHIVVLMTDTAPHPLDHPKRPETAGYPKGVPENLTGLMVEWDDGQGTLSSNARRMAIFAPEDAVWRKMNDTWQNVNYIPCRAGAGLSDQDMGFVVNWIAKSV